MNSESLEHLKSKYPLGQFVQGEVEFHASWMSGVEPSGN